MEDKEEGEVRERGKREGGGNEVEKEARGEENRRQCGLRVSGKH